VSRNGSNMASDHPEPADYLAAFLLAFLAALSPLPPWTTILVAVPVLAWR